ncbi:unnamed protein product [Adineta steineri]|uniref:G-protein coupled receptors family 1 profile domain-containing protein n=1 Tax=Adineta steineri TaxID=433720 RepID=A0A815T5V5_9BILA|nr:unnamed protein product [Adineta steineri]CAF1499330.1 unnamed protein product [Adineta steineri]
MSFPWHTTEFISVCFGIILIILLTVGGNLVVLFAFCNDPHLLTPSNNFILSMAIADLLVGLIGMPFHSYAQIKHSWPFGELFCKIWITIDDVVTMASVLSIVAITIERYWSINHSVHYRRHTTKTRIRIFSVLIWLIPVLNFAPGIWLLESNENIKLLNSIDNRTTETKFECIGAYHTHTLYLIMSQINFFAWPLVVIIVLNVLIVVNLYKRSHRFSGFVSFRVPQNKQQRKSNSLKEQYRQIIEEEDQEQQQQQQQLHRYPQNIDDNVHTVTVVDEANCHLINKIDSEHRSTNHSEKALLPVKELDEIPDEDGSVEFQSTPLNNSEARQSINLYSRFKQAFIPSSIQMDTLSVDHRTSLSTQAFCMPTVKRKSMNNPILVWRHHSLASPLSALHMAKTTNTTNGTGEQRTVRRLRRDKRAATSLFTLVLVFMIFLLPYVFVVVVGRIFSVEILTDTNGQVYSAAFWLLWLNSTVNPILYPFIQPRFREAYRKLFIRFARRQRRLASLIADMHRSK